MNKIEEYLIDLMYTYRELDENLWLIEDPDHTLDGVAILYSGSQVIIRASVMDAPKEHRLEFFTKLLELNASDMIHGAYGLAEEKVVIVDTLEYNTMDDTEFKASLDAISLALTQHFEIFSKYRELGRGR